MVAVQRGVREGEHGVRVLEQTADVPAGDVAELAVAGLIVEQRLALVPQRLVRVHAGAVVAVERLRHEGDRLAPLLSGVLDDVLELQNVVCRVHHRVETVVDLLLATGADLVVRPLEREAGLDQVERHLVAQVGRLVDRCHGEVAALVRRLVAEVPALFLAPGVPRALFRIDAVEASVGRDRVAHIVEDVELRLRGEERRVGDAGGCQVLLGLLGDLTRVLGVDLAGAGVVDVEQHHQRLGFTELVEIRGGHIRDQLHVGFVDAGEAPDRRAVEELAVGEERLIDGRRRDVEVLLHAGQIGEPDVKELDVVLLDIAQHFGRIGEHVSLLDDSGLRSSDLHEE